MAAPSTFNEADADRLDADISSIRAEIRNLQRRKRFVISSLLASAPVQSKIRAATSTTTIAPPTTPTTTTKADEDVSPLVQAAGRYASLNHHRVAFSVTTFPFKDPAPTRPGSRDTNRKLLGVRIDVCTRAGRFTQPYYLLLKKDASAGDEENAASRAQVLRVYRHTIPSFISMNKLESAYLPRSRLSRDNDYEAEDDDAQLPKPTKSRRQTLPALVRHVRKELTAWHLRRDAVTYLQERLNLKPDNDNDIAESPPHVQPQPTPKNSYGIVSLAPVSLETRHVRIEWDDGRVGRMKISDRGRVERAVVIGDGGRDKSVENLLTGGDGRVERVLERLNVAR